MGTQKNRILLLNEGDRRAFHSIFDEWYEHMCFFANKILDDQTASEDIVQESFIGLWENRTKIETEQHLKAFLYRVIRNKSLNFLRHEEIKRKYAAEVPLEIESDDFFVRIVIEEEVKRILFETREQLTPKCKEVFDLAIIGYKNEEIVEELGISINTVKTHKRVAYGILKKKISATLILISLLGI